MARRLVGFAGGAAISQDIPDDTPAPTVPFVSSKRTIVIGRRSYGDVGGSLRALEWMAAKGSDEPARFRVDYTAEVAKYWEPRSFVVGDRISTGPCDARCVDGGHTGLSEPRWPTTNGAVVPDGSLRWEIGEPTEDSLVEIETVEWELPTEITIENPRIGATSTSAVPKGGEAGKSYTIVVKVRFKDGEGFDQPCVLRIE